MMHWGHRLILQNLFVPIRITRFNIDKTYIFPIKCIYVFHMIIAVNINYFPTQHSETGLCNGNGLRFLSGRSLSRKWNWDNCQSKTIVLYYIVLYCGRVPAVNAPGCTAAEGLLYKSWSLVFLLAPPDVSTRDPSSERRNYLGEKWPMNFAWKCPTST